MLLASVVQYSIFPVLVSRCRCQVADE